MVVYAAAVALLVVSGAAKLWRPRPTADALAALGPTRLTARTNRRLSRVIGAGEIAIAASGQPLAVAAAYLAFSLVVARQLQQGPTASCGCVGGDSPATPLHLLLTLGAAAGSITAPGLTTDPLLLAIAAVLAGLALAVMTALADLTSALEA